MTSIEILEILEQRQHVEFDIPRSPHNVFTKIVFHKDNGAWFFTSFVRWGGSVTTRISEKELIKNIEAHKSTIESRLSEK